MSESIENLRILAETTFDDFPDSSITAWVEQAIKDYDELERELSKAIDIIEDSGVDYDEVVKAIDS